MIEFEILASGYFSPDQITVTYDPTAGLTFTAETQAWMDSYWEEKVQQASARGMRLYNGPLFRLVEVLTQPDGTMHIATGNTSYKEYVTTRIPEFFQGRQRQELGNPISVCSVVETSDNYILLDRRQGVDVYEGRYHVIGGFFERNLDMTTRPDPFAAMRREIREETGIQLADIREQHCLGIGYDTTVPHPELCFLTHLNIPLAEVQTRQPEDNEIAELHTLQATAENLREFLLRHHGNISATGEVNLLFYGAWKFGQPWYQAIMEQIT